MEGRGEGEQPQEAPKGGRTGERTGETRLWGWKVLAVSALVVFIFSLVGSAGCSFSGVCDGIEV